MHPADLERLRTAIRDVPDFPKPGILFKDITPVLADPVLFRLAVEAFVGAGRDRAIDKVVGIDARGFIFGAAVAHALGVGFVPVRKKGKLPYRCEESAYALEYGEATVEMHVDAIQPGERVLLIDDLLATGGTAAAALALIRQMQGEAIEALFFIELAFLGGRRKLGDIPARAIVVY